MKIKSIGKKKLKPQITFPVDLQKFVEQPKKTIKRLPLTSEFKHPNLVIKRDEIMEEEEKRKKFKIRLEDENSLDNISCFQDLHSTFGCYFNEL